MPPASEGNRSRERVPSRLITCPIPFGPASKIDPTGSKMTRHANTIGNTLISLKTVNGDLADSTLRGACATMSNMRKSAPDKPKPERFNLSAYSSELG